MAISLNTARFLLGARKRGVSFERTLTFGRQNLDVLPGLLKSMFEQHGLPSGLLLEEMKRAGRPCYAEPFFRALGAKEISSVDASAYQESTVVHDMNLPLPVGLTNRFDAVFDGGALEHVFQAPTALKNCMEMVKVGGHLICHSPANNWFGHGFYQFSPELFYRALSKENGFEIERMVAHPIGAYGRWYEVADPAEVGGRVELINWYPVALLVQARRTREVDIFARAPQQSDYVSTWQQDKPLTAQPADGFLKTHFPQLASILRAVPRGWVFLRVHSFANRRSFQPTRKE